MQEREPDLKLFIISSFSFSDSSLKLNIKFIELYESFSKFFVMKFSESYMDLFQIASDSVLVFDLIYVFF